MLCGEDDYARRHTTPRHSGASTPALCLPKVFFFLHCGKDQRCRRGDAAGWSKLIFPFLELDINILTLAFHTGMPLTTELPLKVLKYNVAIKCAIVSADEARVKEFNLKQMWKSPNGTIWNIINVVRFLDGSVAVLDFALANAGSRFP